MKLVVDSLTNMTSTGSITGREWEALARFVVQISDLQDPELNGLESMSMREVQTVGPVLVRRAIRREMYSSGLRPSEWWVQVTPEALPGVPLGDRPPYRWFVTMRLIPDKSDAKTNAGNEPPAEPTLAERK